MDRALIIESGIEWLVSAEDISHEYHGNIPRRVRFICPFCRQPLCACSMKPRNKNAPHFKHEKNNKIAHECEMYASNSTFSNVYHRMPMPVYLRKSLGSDSIFIMELGFRQLDRNLIADLESEGAVLEIGKKRYNVTSERFGNGAVKLPIDSPKLAASSLVRLSHSRLNLFVTWGRPEDSRNAMVFSADLDTLRGKRISYCDSIEYGSQLMIVVPHSGETELRMAIGNLKRLGTVSSSFGDLRLTVYSAIAPNADDSEKKTRLYLERCGYSFADGGETPTIIWPPSSETSNEFEPIFKSERLVFTSPTADSKEYIYLHSPYDADRDIRRVPFIRAKGGNGDFAVVRTSNQMRFASSKNSVRSAAVLLWSRGDIIARILDDSAFLVKYENAESEAATIHVPFPCRIRTIDRKKGSVSTFDLRAFEAMQLHVGEGDSFTVARPLRASSGFLQILSYEAVLNSTTIKDVQNLEKRILLLKTRYPLGKKAAILRQKSSNIIRQNSTTLARIRKGKR